MTNNINFSELTFELMCENIKNGVNFSMSRFGDGEWNCILGAKGTNCDKHTYFPELGEKIRSILNKPQQYYLGLQNFAKTLNPVEIDKYTKKYNIQWFNADIVHKASINGVFFDELFSALRHRLVSTNNSITFVAPVRLYNKIPELISYGFLVVPEVNCFSEYDTILKTLKESHKDGDIVLYCASMMSNALIDEMFEYSNGNIIQIDLRSVLEPYAGYSNRTYHNKIIDKLNNK